MTWDWREWRQGLADISPVLIAVVPIGLLWGTLAAGKGLSATEALLMSLLVFAGASQFVALEMWSSPAPILLLAFTAFIVNIRHVLMSASISRHIPSIPRRLHPLMAYFLVDESWALGEKRALNQPLTLSYYLGVATPLWVSWNTSTIAGALLGRDLGDPAALGIDFAFSAMFIGILMGFWKGSRTAAVLAVAGFAAALAKLWVPGAWYIVIGGMAGALCAALLHSEQEGDA